MSADALHDSLDGIHAELEILQHNMRFHAVGSGAFKIVGQGLVGIVGGALAIAAPFTAGATVVPALWCTGVTVSTTVGNGICDHVKDKEFKEKMNKANERLKRSCREYMDVLGQDGDPMDEMLLNGGKDIVCAGSAIAAEHLTTTTTTATTVTIASKRGGEGVARLQQGTELITKTAENAETIAPKVYEAISQSGKAGHIAEGGGQTVATATKTTTTVSTTAKVLGVAGGLFCIGVAAWDLSKGVEQIANNGATEKQVENMKRQIRTLQNNLRGNA